MAFGLMTFDETAGMIYHSRLQEMVVGMDGLGVLQTSFSLVDWVTRDSPLDIGPYIALRTGKD